MTKLASLRLHPQQEIDLIWFLADEHRGALGLKSSMGPMIDRLQLGYVNIDSARHFEIDDRVLESAARYDRVLKRWRATPPDARDVLTAAYGPRRFPELADWGALGGLVLASQEAHAAYRRSGTARPLPVWLARLLTRPAAAPLRARIRLDAETRLARAAAAWEAARPPRRGHRAA